MATSLKDKAKCLGLVSDSNTTLKEAALAKLGALGAAIKLGASSALSSVTGAISSAFSALTSTISSEWDAITSSFDALTSISLDGIFSSTCTDATEASATAPKTDPVGGALALPASNDETVSNASPVTKIKASEIKAASKGVTAMAEVVGSVDTAINSAGLEDGRQLRRLYINKHPSLASYTKNLANFKPVSESVGASVLAYTVDKPSLQLKNWITGAPICVRKNLQTKVRSELLSEIQNTYTKLNTGIYNNISDEFTEVSDVSYNTAHAYHVIGDELFYLDHMTDSTLLYTTYATTIGTTMGSRMNFINYLSPVNPAITINNNIYGVSIEGKSTAIDVKSNIAINPFTKVNNDVLKPGTLNDE